MYECCVPLIAPRRAAASRAPSLTDPNLAAGPFFGAPPAPPTPWDPPRPLSVRRAPPAAPPPPRAQLPSARLPTPAQLSGPAAPSGPPPHLPDPPRPSGPPWRGGHGGRELRHSRARPRGGLSAGPAARRHRRALGRDEERAADPSRALPGAPSLGGGGGGGARPGLTSASPGGTRAATWAPPSCGADGTSRDPAAEGRQIPSGAAGHGAGRGREWGGGEAA